MKAVLASLAFFLLAAPSAAQTTLFSSDFESGVGPWTLTGEWHWVPPSDRCAGEVAPFPSPAGAMRYGIQGGLCNFGNQLLGEMVLQTPVSLPADASNISLRLDSFDRVECANCGWDWRFAYVSNDLGQSWTLLGGSVRLEEWYELAFDLTPWTGQDVLVKLQFDAVDGAINDGLGWIVDDVQIIADGSHAARYCPIPTEGLATFIDWSGSLSYSENDFTLHINQSVALAPHLFLVGSAPAATPLGNGVLCIAPGPTGILRLGPPIELDFPGNGRRAVDLFGDGDAPPLVAGETWYFQSWRRDFPASSTFSDALAVTFAP